MLCFFFALYALAPFLSAHISSTCKSNSSNIKIMFTGTCLSGGAVAGIVVACVVALIIIIIVIILLLRQRNGTSLLNASVYCFVL